MAAVHKKKAGGEIKMLYEIFMYNPTVHLLVSIAVAILFVVSAGVFILGLVFFFRDRETREDYEQYKRNRPGKKI